MQVARDLAMAGIAYLAYRTAKGASKSTGRVPALLKGGGFILVLAALAAFNMGKANCEDSDPLYGGCSQYADNGFEPTDEQRGATFLYWVLFLGVPVAMGALSERGDPLRPWAKPSRKQP